MKELTNITAIHITWNGSKIDVSVEINSEWVPIFSGYANADTAISEIIEGSFINKRYIKVHSGAALTEDKT